MTFDDGGMALNLAQAPQVTQLALQRWMTRVLERLHQAVSRNIAKGGLVGRRTGNLARALQSAVTVTSNGMLGELWPDPIKAPYGGIQEEGGTIIPKTAKNLTIPLEAMLTGNGVARGTARQVIADPSAFGFVDTFKPKNSSVIMGTTTDGSAIPLFALKPSVTIPGRHYLQTTLVQEWQWIADELERATDEVVQVIFGPGATA